MDHKLAALQRSGCQDKISWSRNGSICYVVDDALKLTYLKCENGDEWDFSSPFTIKRPHITGTAPNSSTAPFQHVCWGPNGTDLAAIDIQGDISIFSTGGNGNVSSVYNSAATSNENNQQGLNHEIDGIVGFKWLDLDKGLLLASPALRNTPGTASPLANYGIIQAKQVGPHNPVANKLACIAITRRGVVRLISQIASDEARYYEVTAALEPKRATIDDLITHATIKGGKDNNLVIATYSRQGTLSIYKVAVNWKTITKPSAGGNGTPHQQHQQQQQQVSLPSYDFAELKIKRIIKTGLSSPECELGEQQYLTHLLLVPDLPQKAPQSSTDNDQLYVVFGSEKKSTVRTYEISTRSLSLHNSFFSLSTKTSNNSNSDENTAFLTLKDTKEMDPVIKLDMASSDTYITISTFNGQVELVPRQQAPPQQPNSGEPKKPIYSLLDAGCKMPQLAENNVVKEMALSPNLISYVHLEDQDDLKIRNIKCDFDWSDENARNSFAVAVAVRNSVAFFLNYSFDDLLYLTKSEVDSRDDGLDHTAFYCTLLREMHRAINFNLDIPKDYQTDKLIMNPSIQRLLSAQMVFGTRHNWRRNGMGRIAWATLNLRLVAFSLAFTLRSMSVPIKQQNLTPQQDFEIRANQIYAMVGLVRWCGDFLSSIAQELYMASLDSENYYKENPQSVGMCVLLGKIPRALLLYSLRGIRGLETLATKTAEQEGNQLNGAVYSALRRLRETIMTSPVSMAAFEKVVTDIDNAMKTMFANKTDRGDAEHELIFRCRIPNDYITVVNRTIDIFSNNLKKDINIPVLHFYDTAWIGTTNIEDPEDEDLAYYPSEEKLDQLRKVVMPMTDAKAKYRTCSRCGGWSQWDGQGFTSTMGNSQWTLGYQKNCLCGGNWYRPEF